MFKKAPAKLSLLLLLTLVLLPVTRLHAQAASCDPPTDVVSGSDPEPTGDPKPKVIDGMDSASEDDSDVVSGSDPEPTGDPKPNVVPELDPQAVMLQALAVGMLIAFRLS